MKMTQDIARRLKNQFNKQFPCLCPVGAVVAWQKNLFTSAPVLPSNWKECNGQTLSDPESPFHLKALPNLNSSPRILKGGVIAGILETFGLKTSNNPDLQLNISSTVWIIRIK